MSTTTSVAVWLGTMLAGAMVGGGVYQLLAARPFIRFRPQARLPMHVRIEGAAQALSGLAVGLFALVLMIGFSNWELVGMVAAGTSILLALFNTAIETDRLAGRWSRRS